MSISDAFTDMLASSEGRRSSDNFNNGSFHKSRSSSRRPGHQSRLNVPGAPDVNNIDLSLEHKEKVVKAAPTLLLQDQIISAISQQNYEMIIDLGCANE